jgi:hypothetical protein
VPRSLIIVRAVYVMCLVGLLQAAPAPQVVEGTLDLLAHAESLDRYNDPEAFSAYQAALDAAQTDEQKQRIARRLAVLALESGDSSTARSAIEVYRQSGGSGWGQAMERIGTVTAGEAGDFGIAEIPGIPDGFLRMAALSTALEPRELLPLWPGT